MPTADPQSMHAQPQQQQQTPREKLEVESPTERQARLSRLLSAQEQDRATGPLSTANAKDTITLPPLRPEIGPLPPSDILARVRDFLPRLAASNEDLLVRAKVDPKEVDIENTQGDARVIEMDLGLGVFDVKGQAGAGEKKLGPDVDMPSSSLQSSGSRYETKGGEERSEAGAVGNPEDSEASEGTTYSDTDTNTNTDTDDMDSDSDSAGSEKSGSGSAERAA